MSTPRTLDGQPPAFVAFRDGALTLGRAPPADIVLRDPTVAIRHATLRRSGSTIVVEDHRSAYGTFINGSRVSGVGDALIGDCVEVGSCVAYSIDPDGLRLTAAPKGMGLTAEGLTIAKDDIPLVFSAAFAIKRGSFVGIIGPSGAGKSTLLQCLAGHLPPAAGELRDDNGREVYSLGEGNLARIGFVPQDDIVLPGFSIRENLEFAAHLRFALANSHDEVESIVEATLEEMGLLDVAENTRYSGGQRKRLSIAIELLKKPRLLLLDEPTSGLDPALERGLMVRLRALAAEGTTVVCTTHTLANLELFDELVVLGRKRLSRPDLNLEVGKIAFEGPPDRLLAGLECRAYPELFDRLHRGEFRTVESVACRFASTLPTTSGRAEHDALPVELSFGELKKVAQRTLKEAGDELAAMASDVPMWAQTRVLIRRSLLSLVRDRHLLASMAIQPIALTVLAVLSQFRMAAAASVLFFIVVIAIWLGMNNAVRDLVRERRQYVRDRWAGMRPQAFFLSKILTHATFGTVQLVLLLLTLFFAGLTFLDETTHQDLSLVWHWPWLLVVLEASLLGGVGMGLLASAMSNSDEAAVALLPLLIMPQLLLSAVATAMVDEPYNHPRPFKPIVAMVNDKKDYSSHSETLVDVLSLGCLSRAATAIADPPRGWKWIGDACHLFILLSATWAGAYAVFLYRERQWPLTTGSC